MIKLCGVVHRCLDIKSLNIPKGKTAVIGKNGSGKSTLLALIAGIQLPYMGSVKIAGKNPRECNIGWISEFPDRNILFFRVYDEIASALRFAHTECKEINSEVKKVSELCGLSNLLDRQVKQISGGEKVLVSLAAAIISRPDILVLDETDSHLDEETCKRVDQIIASFPLDAVVYSTHNMDWASEADNVVYIKEGLLISSGSPKKVFDDFNLKHTCFYPMSWRIWGSAVSAD